MLAAPDHPFSDLRVDPQDWLGSTVVSGEGQILQGRLTISTYAFHHNKATNEMARPEIVGGGIPAPMSHLGDTTTSLRRLDKSSLHEPEPLEIVQKSYWRWSRAV